MKKACILAGLMLGASLSALAITPPQARAEISHLLSTLESSDCQFGRNGAWYDGKQAAAHLQKKREYLEQRDQIKSAEDFIKKAASQSSTSGDEYKVRCPKLAELKSADWFQGELKKQRLSGK
ncbi:DUF5329 family protein [Massilia sp. W12]|uniref:DUF5329 family protein n=1 Tax=Massilia sp. W12 TaxID=3126507 RepID=UPI0030CE890B